MNNKHNKKKVYVYIYMKSILLKSLYPLILMEERFVTILPLYRKNPNKNQEFIQDFKQINRCIPEDTYIHTDWTIIKKKDTNYFKPNKNFLNQPKFHKILFSK